MKIDDRRESYSDLVMRDTFNTILLVIMADQMRRAYASRSRFR